MFDPLVTPNLTLRPLIQEDAPVLARYRGRPEVARYQGWSCGGLPEAEAFISELAHEPDLPGSWYQLAITLKVDSQMIGDIGLHFPTGKPRQSEVGITLSPEHQGQGYATEALCSALAYLFGQLGKHRVYASIDPRNHRSIGLFERVGMRCEAHLCESLWFKGAWADDLIYALLRREWEARGSESPCQASIREHDLIEKVTCFVHRDTERGSELLFFEHPYAGVQLPAGTVEPGESTQRAAMREAHEETGLCGLIYEQALGVEETLLPESSAAVVSPTTVSARPDRASFGWARLPRGAWVSRLRTVAEWEQVNYQEPDSLVDPTFTSYQITGWVPAGALAHKVRRSFHLLRCERATPAEWVVHTDSHDFRLFWAPVGHLPQLVEPQDQWLRWLPWKASGGGGC